MSLAFKLGCSIKRLLDATIDQDKVIRRNWVKDLVIPRCEYKLNKLLTYKPYNVCDSLDPYLTIDERCELLVRHGWVEHFKYDGKDYYRSVKQYELTRTMEDYVMANKHIIPAEKYKVFRTGEEY